MRISTYLKKVTLPEGSNGLTLEVKRWAVSIARGRPRIQSMIASREFLAI